MKQYYVRLTVRVDASSKDAARNKARELMKHPESPIHTSEDRFGVAIHDAVKYPYRWKCETN